MIASVEQTRVPVPDTFRSEEDRVDEVHVPRRPISKGLSRVEDEWYLQPKLLLAFHEAFEGFQIVDERFQRVFMADKVEACTHHIRHRSNTTARKRGTHRR